MHLELDGEASSRAGKTCEKCEGNAYSVVRRRRGGFNGGSGQEIGVADYAAAGQRRRLAGFGG